MLASLVAQLVKNLPTMQETRVRSLGCNLYVHIREAWHAAVHEVAESDMTGRLNNNIYFYTHTHHNYVTCKQILNRYETDNTNR